MAATHEPDDLAGFLRSRVSQKCLDLLDSRDGKHSTWATACAIGMHARNAEFTEDEFITLVNASDFAWYFATEEDSSGQRTRMHRLNSRLSKVWEAVEEGWNPPITDRDDLRRELAQLQVRISDHRFPGRGAATDRKVALAVVEYCYSLPAKSPMLSKRHVAELAGVGAETARRSLLRLTDHGLLRKSPETMTSGAAKYVVQLGWRRVGGTEPSNPCTRGERTTWPVTANLRHPAFVRAALGPNAERVYLDFCWDEPQPVSVIARELNLPRRTVSDNLVKLVSNGLAYKTDDYPARYAMLVGDLDVIAKEYETGDWFERQTERHEADRRGFEEQKRQWAEAAP